MGDRHPLLPTANARHKRRPAQGLIDDKGVVLDTVVDELIVAAAVESHQHRRLIVFHRTRELDEGLPAIGINPKRQSRRPVTAELEIEVQLRHVLACIAHRI